VRHPSALLVGLIVVVFAPVTAQAQAALSPGAGTLDGVVKELRLLRQAFERQNSAMARAQLLLGRMTLQDQRTARAQQAVERLRKEVADAEREREEHQSRFRAIAQRLEQSNADDPRQQLEEESKALKARLAESQARLSAAEARLSQATQALEVETGRSDELDAWLRDLDKQLAQASGQ